MRKLLLLLVFALALPIGMLAAGTTWQEAIELSQGGSSKGSLSKDVTVQWFKIVVPEDGDVTIKVTPSGDLGLNYTTLYAKDTKNEMHSRGYVWATGEFTVTDCAAGTYYVEVKWNGGSGSFTVSYSFKAMSASYKNDQEPNDTWQNAKDLVNHTNSTGHLGYLYYGDTDKVDWYKIDIPENGSVKVTVIAHGRLGLNYTTLYAKDNVNEMHSRGYVWAGNEESAGVFTVNDCAKGTYYLEVKHNGGEGGYTLKYDFTPTSSTYANDAEPNDAWQNAQELKRGNTVTGHLGYLYYGDRDNVDWFKIDVPRDGTVKLTITPHDNLGLNYTTIYAKDNLNEMHSRGYCWSGPETITVADAAPGTYFVEVKQNGGEGAYSLQYVFEQSTYATDAEPNDSKSQALPITKGATVAGHLGYTYYDDRDNVDWYTFKLTAKSDVTFTYQGEGSLGFNYVTLYNSELKSQEYKWGGDDKNMNTFTKKDLEAGTYYVEVKRNGGQGYYLLAYDSKIGTVDKQEPLPDAPQGGTKTVKQDGTTFEVDETNKTVTIKDVTPDDEGDIIICKYPGLGLPWKVEILQDIFDKIPGKNVTIDYPTPPEVKGTIPEDKVGDKTLHVPAGTKKEYEDDPEWSKFGSIKDDNNLGSTTNLIAWLSESEKHYYNFVEKPKITISGGKYVVTTSTTTVTYEYGQVLKFTLDDSGSSQTAIAGPAATAAPAVERRGESVVFTGCRPGSPIYIYNVGGQVVGTLSTDGNGRAEVIISDLKAGVYVVKADSVTIKIAKR